MVVIITLPAIDYYDVVVNGGLFMFHALTSFFVFLLRTRFILKFFVSGFPLTLTVYHYVFSLSTRFKKKSA